MAIRRELTAVHLTVAADPANDYITVNWRIVDDIEGTTAYREKEINVGAQVRAALDPLVTVILEKLTNDTRTVTRPAPEVVAAAPAMASVQAVSVEPAPAETGDSGGLLQSLRRFLP